MAVPPPIDRRDPAGAAGVAGVERSRLARFKRVTGHMAMTMQSTIDFSGN